MIAAGRLTLLLSLGIASCAPTGDLDRMKPMRNDEVAAVLARTLKPLLLEAGFTRNVSAAALEPLLLAGRFTRIGERWTSRRGDAIRSVDLVLGGDWVVLRAGIGFWPALQLLQTAALPLDLSYGTIPASDLLQLYLTGPAQESRHEGGGMVTASSWAYEGLTAAALAESVTDTFRSQILRFFEDKSTVEAALREVQNERRYGDCGPMSYFQPRINKFFLAALYKERGDRESALRVVQQELAYEKPYEPWPAFREWIDRP